jgi:hypothetical protein
VNNNLNTKNKKITLKADIRKRHTTYLVPHKDKISRLSKKSNVMKLTTLFVLIPILSFGQSFDSFNKDDDGPNVI